MMVLTDANSVPKGRNDRITGKGLNGGRIGTHHLTDTLGPKQLNFIDTYRHKHPEGALMTHHNKTAKSYSKRKASCSYQPICQQEETRPELH